MLWEVQAQVPFLFELSLQSAEQKSAQETAEKSTPLMTEAIEMLKKWEAGDEKTVALWKKMNGWV